MITFRSKQLIQDLMPKALEHLSQKGIRPNIITRDQSDEVSKVNSRAMVIISFIKNENGYYQIQVQDKSLYNYTQKLLKDIFKMKITNIDRDNRIITAETDYLGVALDIIEILGIKYNLSIVQV